MILAELPITLMRDTEPVVKVSSGLKILGIDPGTTRVGWAVLTADRGKVGHARFGCLFFEKTDIAVRHRELYAAIRDMIRNESPDAIAVERIFFSKNKKTALLVSEARGTILAAIQGAGVPVYSYNPLQVKQAVGASGADKKGVQKMVQLLLGLAELPTPDDAADALALAICCAHEYWAQSFPKKG